ncbi:uncharacterized protein LOC132269686 [Cornus florida]|uniref:uncharacterized protein LOC132269686 n=1 Tax=Cornus florida TaxID=4283 RepID=UPI00289E286C|nr:uncharacterized protein LOC132269686 [Cornus florida]
MEDYDFDLQYHPGKVNVITDALSRKSRGSMASIAIREWKMMENITENDILREFHYSRLAVHPGGIKMYHNLRHQYWWKEMKKDVAQFVARCLTCQQVKEKHRRPAGLLQPLPVAKWKWEHVTIDLMIGLPRSQQGHDVIWVVVDRLTNWEDHLSLVEFAYNNSYRSSIGMAPFEALYGRPFQSRQKSYADRRQRLLSFEVGDHVFLKVSPCKGLLRFRLSGKLSARFIRPFKILERVGEDLEIEKDVSYKEQLMDILDSGEKVLRSKTIPLVKVLWKHHGVDEATWERETDVRSMYPDLFTNEDMF